MLLKLKNVKKYDISLFTILMFLAAIPIYVMAGKKVKI
jgi:hypothetical protein